MVRPTVSTHPLRVWTSFLVASGTGGRPCVVGAAPDAEVLAVAATFLGAEPCFLTRFAHACSIDFSTPSSACWYSA